LADNPGIIAWWLESIWRARPLPGYVWQVSY